MRIIAELLTMECGTQDHLKRGAAMRRITNSKWNGQPKIARVTMQLNLTSVGKPACRLSLTRTVGRTDGVSAQ